MAEHRVTPHLIVVLGSQIWEAIWRSLHLSHQQAQGGCASHAHRVTRMMMGPERRLVL